MFDAIRIDPCIVDACDECKVGVAYGVVVAIVLKGLRANTIDVVPHGRSIIARRGNHHDQRLPPRPARRC